MKPLLLILMLQAVSYGACREGYVPTDVDGVCQQSIYMPNYVPKWVSDEKPPADKMPSWQREGITVIDAPKTEYQNLEWIAERDAKEKKK